MSDFQLGDWVGFTKHLHRRERLQNGGSEKVWVSDAWPGATEPEMRRGVVVGVRTLSDGETSWGQYDEPTTYFPLRHFTAYLVSFHLRRKPVLVLPEYMVKVLGPKDVLPPSRHGTYFSELFSR